MFILPLGGSVVVVVVVWQLLLLQFRVSVSDSVPTSVIDNENTAFVLHNEPPSSGNGLSQSLALN